jgi:hypothetical protein
MRRAVSQGRHVIVEREVMRPRPLLAMDESLARHTAAGLEKTSRRGLRAQHKREARA